MLKTNLRQYLMIWDDPDILKIEDVRDSMNVLFSINTTDGLYRCKLYKDRQLNTTFPWAKVFTVIYGIKIWKCQSTFYYGIGQTQRRLSSTNNALFGIPLALCYGIRIHHFDGLLQKTRNFVANTLELRLLYINPFNAGPCIYMGPTLGHHCACRCPSASWCQAISRNSIGYTARRILDEMSLPWGDAEVPFLTGWRHSKWHNCIRNLRIH